MRIDKYLAENGYVTSRSKAAQLIKEGAIKVDGKIADKPSIEVEDGAVIEVDNSSVRYVSRGGLKLEGALDSFNIDVTGMKAVDIGASTGGFTDCLLKRGAKRVYAIDSGTLQLDESLREDQRVVSIENFNARHMTKDTTEGECDIAVCDLSFISQTLIYKALTEVLRDGGIFVSLIKPQFEVGKNKIGKGGIVRDPAARENAVRSVILSAKNYGLVCKGRIESPIKGGDGNTEYLAYFVYDKKENTVGGE